MKIYLQFDGLEETTHLALRGRDLRNAKAQALDRCADAELTVLLVAAVEAGVTPTSSAPSSATASPTPPSAVSCSSPSPTPAATPPSTPVANVVPNAAALALAG